MGFEFFGDVTGTGDYETAIRRVLADDPEVEVLSSQSASVVLRFRTHPLLAEWPEDVQVHFRPKQVYVLFHGATGQERAYLLDVVERAIAEVGCEGRLVED